jgi:hypothetical protein
LRRRRSKQIDWCRKLTAVKAEAVIAAYIAQSETSGGKK